MTDEEFMVEFFDALRGVRLTFNRGRIACPGCGAAYDAECLADCPIRGCSRLREPCDDCGGDLRICGCFHRYEERGAEAEMMPCPACKGRGARLYAREAEDGCDECEATGRVPAEEGE